MNFTLLLTILSFPLLGQDRYLSHVTPASSAFASQLICENASFETQVVVLKAFNEKGLPQGSKQFELGPGQRQVFSVSLEFAETQVAYFVIEGSTQVHCAVSIERNSYDGSVVLLPETSEQASLWTFLPSLKNGLFDGFALINPQSYVTGIEVRLRAADGSLREKTYNEVAPGAKLLVVANELFKSQAGDYLEVIGYDPFLLTVLGGSYPGSGGAYLWTNLAVANQWSAGLADAFQQSRVRWYPYRNQRVQYESLRVCFCQQVKRVLITEENGQILSMLDAETQVPIPAEEWSNFVTIQGAFFAVDQAMANHYQRLQVTFDPDYGFPSHIQSDVHEFYADDETDITLTNFRILN